MTTLAKMDEVFGGGAGAVEMTKCKAADCVKLIGSGLHKAATDESITDAEARDVGKRALSLAHFVNEGIEKAEGDDDLVDVPAELVDAVKADTDGVDVSKADDMSKRMELFKARVAKAGKADDEDDDEDDDDKKKKKSAGKADDADADDEDDADKKKSKAKKSDTDGDGDGDGGWDDWGDDPDFDSFDDFDDDDDDE